VGMGQGCPSLQGKGLALPPTQKIFGFLE